ncbi:MAG: hypothetical protein DRJ09_01365 [Bacteroidetes bacterium]|nr:MAG: hypothetical protein DRJ09_01365 [Bacteroidota bacterium]
MREVSEIIHEVESTEDKKKLERLLTEINTRLNNKVDVDLLLCRAGILTKFQQYGMAINDYSKVLEIDPDSKHATTQIDLLKTILRYTNTDIYASPNTNMDPWLE